MSCLVLLISLQILACRSRVLSWEKHTTLVKVGHALPLPVAYADENRYISSVNSAFASSVPAKMPVHGVGR